MGRAPCCEKMGLKKGPWTPEEDQILVNYVSLYGHGNWRALPRLAGLLRCGKSCRLRWINYLRPDIKRGNFTREEEQTIIELHAAMGNRWSAIAARLPGRTDNEIKNVWHTHLKKRVLLLNINREKEYRVSNYKQQDSPKLNEDDIESSSPSPSSSSMSPRGGESTTSSQLIVNSPQHSYNSDNSSVLPIRDTDHKPAVLMENVFQAEMDEDFWSEIFSGDQSSDESFTEMEAGGGGYKYKSSMHDDMQFWLNVLTRRDELLLDI